MGKAINSATQVLNEQVKTATDIAIINVKQSTNDFMKETNKVKEEINNVKMEFRFESDLRKFMFWATPILLLAQSIAMVILLLR